MSYKNAATEAYASTAAMATPLRSVIMLYDGVIRLVRGAKRAIEENRIEDRFNLTQKASKIVLGLQASLDWEHGGDVTPTLHGFYNTIFMRLQQVNYRNSAEICDDIVQAMENVRDSWTEVERRAGSGGAASAAPAPKPATSGAYGQAAQPDRPASGEGKEAPAPPPKGGFGITI